MAKSEMVSMQKIGYFEVEFSRQSEKWKHLGPKFSLEVKSRILQQARIISDVFEMAFIALPALSKNFKKSDLHRVHVLFERWTRLSAKKYVDLRGEGFKATTQILSKPEYWERIQRELKVGDAIVAINYGHDEDEDFETTIRHEMSHVIISSFEDEFGVNYKLSRHFVPLKDFLVNFFEGNEKLLRFLIKKYGKKRGTTEFVCECIARMKV